MRTKTAANLRLCLAGHVLGQSTATQLKFEVASIKPSAPDTLGTFNRFLPGGGLRITGATWSLDAIDKQHFNRALRGLSFQA